MAINLSYFLSDKLYDAGRKFFDQELSIKLSQSAVTNLPAKPLLGDFIKGKDAYLLNEITEAYLLGKVDENTFENKSTSQIDLDTESKKDTNTYKGILVFAIKTKGKTLSRNEIAKVTRALNRRAKDKPVILLTLTGDFLNYSTADRTTYKQKWREGEQVGKITMLKDINLHKTHEGHRRILWDMKINPFLIDSFDALYEHWKKVFSVQILNETFYKELQNWFFWAQEHVTFPDDLESDEEIRNSKKLIRLLTRVIFIWFIKEKGLVPAKIFSRDEIESILKDFYDNNGKGTTYYHAILQNLFFGTLNQKMNDREFIQDEGYIKNRTNQGAKNYYRYADYFKISERDAIKLFEDVPFLNGGLFDCLDKDDENTKHVYVDGFSRSKKKQAKVPDFLFFDKEHDEDLNKFLGASGKHQKVRGLINILDSYKFTVTENTPVEIEVALDPELLGKIFENLLASYNPETKTTARKQTGSFYTPREVVNYMVDESLITYLENALIGFYENPILKESNSALEKNLFGDTTPKQAQLNISRPKVNAKQKEEINSHLRHLLSYTEEEPLFNVDERKLLIHAIDNCNILDPACGSGAFPMGVLHKMVHILQKLDHDNEKWKELQRRKAIEDTEDAYKIGDQKERDDRLREISDVFENNSSDYGRKLYLIENCIYGVDIQTIAVQIAKLRFFISLVIDQSKQENVENFGIRSLPNLETKFVAANTLIALETPDQLKIENEKIKQLKASLRDVRHEYFRAKNRNDKKRCQKKDKKIRNEIGEIIKEELLDFKNNLIANINLKVNELALAKKASQERLAKVQVEKHNKLIQKKITEIEELKSGLLDSKVIDSLAQQISGWDPYDQNTSSHWFDNEWMFGIKKGFDIVIGNPPYISIANLPVETNKTLSQQHFETYSKGADIYCLFFEKGLELLKDESILCYISSNRFCFTNYGLGLRKYLSEKNLLQIINFNQVDVFESANVGSAVLLVQKAKPSDKSILAYESKTSRGENLATIIRNESKQLSKEFFKESQWSFDENNSQYLKLKIERKGIPLIKWKGITINRGITTGANHIFIIDKKTRAELVSADSKCKEILLPVLKGANIKRYYITEPNQFLIYSYTDINITKYPSVYEYLKGYKEELQEVYEAKHGQKKWYELRRCNYYDNFQKRKLVWTRLSNQNAFSISDNGEFTVDSSSFAVGENIEYLSAILNSKVVLFYFKLGSVIWGKDGIKWFGNYFDNIPIPEISSDDKKTFKSLVDKILLAKKGNKDTIALENEIDVMVYKLYNLTHEEVKIIDPEFTMSKKEYDALPVIETEKIVPAAPTLIPTKKKRKNKNNTASELGLDV